LLWRSGMKRPDSNPVGRVDEFGPSRKR